MKTTKSFDIDEENRKRSNKRGGINIYNLLVFNDSTRVFDLLMTQDYEDKLVVSKMIVQASLHFKTRTIMWALDERTMY